MSMTHSASPTFHRNKVVVAWLASLLGLFSVHWWYLGRRNAWFMTTFAVVMLVLAQFYPVWWDSPPFLVLLLPVSAGMIEALVFALMADEKFDARYNPDSDIRTQTGWDAVIVAIVTTFLAGTVILFGIAMVVIHVYTAMGWLDGYNF